MKFLGSRRQADADNANFTTESLIAPSSRQQPAVEKQTEATSVQRAHARYTSLYRWSIFFFVDAVLFANVRAHPLSTMDFGAAFVAVCLLFLIRSSPLTPPREKSLTFTAPLVFGLLLWMGPVVAAVSAFVACALHAQWALLGRNARSVARFQGVQLALSAFAAGGALTMLHSSFGGGWAAHTALTAVNTVSPLGRMGAAALGAIVFAGAAALIAAGANPEQLVQILHDRSRRVAEYPTAQTFLLGSLAVVLLSALPLSLGMAVGLPLALLLTLAGRVARLQAEVRSLRGQLRTAEEMGRASVADLAATDVAVLLNRFLTLGQELVAAERTLFWTLDQDTGELTPTAALPTPGPFANKVALYGEGLIGHAASRVRPRIVADVARDPHRIQSDPGSGTWLLYPLVVHGELIGVAQWVRPIGQPFADDDIARLASLVPQAAIALENVKIRDRMHEMAATDGLTGLWNHRCMYDLLREEMNRATRYKRALSVLMMDVDSFKSFNDTYGHPQGDQMLKSIALILGGSVRNVDHLGRYGGEEFLVILPETGKDDACRLAERIRLAVEEQAYVLIAGEQIHRTLSVGVASYPEDALNPVELVQRADEALYRAKRSGKNCVIWA